MKITIVVIKSTTMNTTAHSRKKPEFKETIIMHRATYREFHLYPNLFFNSRVLILGK